MTGKMNQQNLVLQQRQFQKMNEAYSAHIYNKIALLLNQLSPS
jgi:hypothetical protein